MKRRLSLWGAALVVLAVGGNSEARSGPSHPAARPFIPSSRIACVDDHSGEPRALPFADYFRHGRLAVTPDGSRLYFSSNRSLSGEGPPKDHDIWYVDQSEDGWGEPHNLGPPINTPRDEIDFSMAADGTLYFNREVQGVPGDLLSAEWLGDRFAEPRALGPAVNSAYLEAAPAISRDGSYLVFTSAGRTDQIGPLDLYVSFRLEDGGWGEPQNLGSPVNSERSEEFPVLSPDGLYLSFVRDDVSGAADVYRVSTDVIERLRPTLGHLGERVADGQAGGRSG